MVSSNPGLYSIGVLAVLMLGISLAANLVWLPALAAWRVRAKP
jgi:predicted RND superfamily exporter protein